MNNYSDATRTQRSQKTRLNTLKYLRDSFLQHTWCNMSNPSSHFSSSQFPFRRVYIYIYRSNKIMLLGYSNILKSFIHPLLREKNRECRAVFPFLSRLYTEIVLIKIPPLVSRHCACQSTFLTRSEFINCSSITSSFFSSTYQGEKKSQRLYFFTFLRMTRRRRKKTSISTNSYW